RRRRAAERPGHLDQRAVDGPRTLAHGHHDRGDDGYHQRHDERLVREPYRQVGDDEEQDARDRQQHDEPALQEVVDALRRAHRRSGGDADDHAHGEGGEHPLGGHQEVLDQHPALVLAGHELQRLDRTRDQVRRCSCGEYPDQEEGEVGRQRQPGADAGASRPPPRLAPDDGRGHGFSIYRHPAYLPQRGRNAVVYASGSMRSTPTASGPASSTRRSTMATRPSIDSWSHLLVVPAFQRSITCGNWLGSGSEYRPSSRIVCQNGSSAGVFLMTSKVSWRAAMNAVFSSSGMSSRATTIRFGSSRGRPSCSSMSATVMISRATPAASMRA